MKKITLFFLNKFEMKYNLKSVLVVNKHCSPKCIPNFIPFNIYVFLTEKRMRLKIYSREMMLVFPTSKRSLQLKSEKKNSRFYFIWVTPCKTDVFCNFTGQRWKTRPKHN